MYKKATSCIAPFCICLSSVFAINGKFEDSIVFALYALWAQREASDE